jgi:hypothetical protein
MGFTHYWTRRQDEIPLPLWQEFTSRLRSILDARSDLLSDVEVTDEVVFFNGCHETFVVERVTGSRFELCKTAQKPYDPVVVAALVLLATITKDDPCGFSWSSDGRADEHEEGVKLSGLEKHEAVGATTR